MIGGASAHSGQQKKRDVFFCAVFLFDGGIFVGIGNDVHVNAVKTVVFW